MSTGRYCDFCSARIDGFYFSIVVGQSGKNNESQDACPECITQEELTSKLFPPEWMNGEARWTVNNTRQEIPHNRSVSMIRRNVTDEH